MIISTGNVGLREIRNEFAGLNTSTLATYMISSSTFTSGSGTVTAPANANLALIYLIGGGGGGARGTAATAGGCGGAFLKKIVTVGPGDGFSYTVGGGGAGRTTTSGNGTAGGDTTTTSTVFSYTLTAGGGGGGTSGGSYTAASGMPSNGDGGSSPGAFNSFNAVFGGDAGARTLFWLSGAGSITAGGAGGNYGGGGGGRIGGNGGNGAGGVAVFYFYNYPNALLRSYLAGGGRVAPHQNNLSVPSSGNIKIGNFRSSGDYRVNHNFISSANFTAGYSTTPAGTPTSPLGNQEYCGFDSVFEFIGTRGTVCWLGTSTSKTTTATITQAYQYQYLFGGTVSTYFGMSGNQPANCIAGVALGKVGGSLVGQCANSYGVGYGYNSIGDCTQWTWNNDGWLLTSGFSGQSFSLTVYISQLTL